MIATVRYDFDRAILATRDAQILGVLHPPMLAGPYDGAEHLDGDLWTARIHDRRGSWTLGRPHPLRS